MSAPIPVGTRFGMLEVLSVDPVRTAARARRYACRCDCGKSIVVVGGSLKSGNTRSCGCLQRKIAAEYMTIHGHAANGKRSRTYDSWFNMLQRCTNSNHHRWSDYGGRGIVVCDRWRGSFENFLADMGERPSGKTIDRIDVDGNYEPSNCRWATSGEQQANRRITRRPSQRWPDGYKTVVGVVS